LTVSLPLDVTNGKFEEVLQAVPGGVGGNNPTQPGPSSALYKPIQEVAPLVSVVPDNQVAVHNVSSSEEDDAMDVISGTPQELLSTGNYDAPVIDVSDGDSVVEFGSTIVFETVDSSADEDSGLADMLGGPGIGYHETRSATSRLSTHASPESV